MSGLGSNPPLGLCPRTFSNNLISIGRGHTAYGPSSYPELQARNVPGLQCGRVTHYCVDGITQIQGLGDQVVTLCAAGTQHEIFLEELYFVARSTTLFAVAVRIYLWPALWTHKLACGCGQVLRPTQLVFEVRSTP